MCLKLYCLLFCLICSQNVPHRIRVRLERRRNEDENAKHKLYTLVSLVGTDDIKGLLTQTIE